MYLWDAEEIQTRCFINGIRISMHTAYLISEFLKESESKSKVVYN